VLRATEALPGLHLSSHTLQTLLNNPKWLASNSLGTLTPQTLYLLERFSHCAHHQMNSEENLLHYLHSANQTPTPLAAKAANDLLSNLLSWSAEEISCLTTKLPTRHAQTMEEVDWVMRCQMCCSSTGLSASTLLKAIDLTAESSSSDWKAVGEAVIAARH